MIKLENIHKRFGDLEVLKGIDLDVNKGEVVSVIGGSGSGKSTLLYCINAIEKIQKGKILVDDIDVHAKETNQDKLRQKLGMVFQQWNSFPHLTVLENAALAPQIVKGFTKEKAQEIAIKRYEITKKRFVLGKITITDLNLALQEKDRSVLRYLNSLEKFWTDYYTLRRLTLYDFIKNEKIKIDDIIYD
mgnify:CR=1 FL=1